MENRYTPRNIRSFIQGYSRYYYDNILGLEEHIKQQVAYRLYVCKDTCLLPTKENKEVGRCQVCKCPTIQKAYATKSCNSDKFPDLMNKPNWEKFMEENNLTNKIIGIQEDIDRFVKMKNNK